MNLEIERKFLLKRHPHKGLSESPDDLVEIQQYYFKNEKGIWERVRRAHYKESDSITYLHTIKRSISPGVKEEIESEISQEDFFKYLDKCDRGIFKDRYIFNIENGLFWEVDYFHQIDITIAEIELPDIKHKFTTPEFIESEILLEVTDIKSFSNRRLALDIKELPAFYLV